MELSVLPYLLDSIGIRTILVFLAAFLLLYMVIRSCFRHDTLPPGPPALPIVGSLPFLGLDPREPLRKMSDKYGDVFTVYMGQRPTVILNSYEAIKEALVGNAQAFAGRPQDLFFVQELTKGMGVVSSEAETWREQRKFLHSVLREFGLGQSILEEKIHEELVHYMQTLEKQVEKPFNPTECIMRAVSNIICSIIFGQRYEYDDPVFRWFLDIFNEAFVLLGNAGALTTFPVLKHLPGDYFGYKKLMKNDVASRRAYNEIVKQHRETSNSDVSRDLIDAYIKHIDQEKTKGTTTTFNDDQLVQVIADLFGAGTETTSTTLRWAIVYMLHHPEVQNKIQKEIDDIVGREGVPSMHDRGNMPYTEATILEIQRAADIVPLGIPHNTTEDIYFRGYLLPKATWVLPHLYAVNRDPKLWHEPSKFDPSRFLDSEGKLDKKVYLIPFSMGKRVCVGESLAKTELFLFLTTMLQRFTFKLPAGRPLPDLTGILTITNIPEDYEVMIVPRC